MKINKINIALLCLFVLVLIINVNSQQDEGIEVQKITEDVYCILGQGGNIGLLKTEKGLIVIDSKYEKTADQVLKTIKSISKKPIKHLVITHYHGDHAGGMEKLAKDAEIIMHEKCQESLIKSMESRSETKVDLPQIITYIDDAKLSLDENETVKLLYMGSGHTSGDTIVVFENNKVIHTGDLFFNGIPPYIDVRDGADTGNWIKIIDYLIENYSDYKVIPGHGPVAEIKDLKKFGEYLKYLRKKVEKAIKKGKTKEQAVEDIKIKGFDFIKDRGDFLTKKRNIEWIYEELKKEK